MYCVSRVIHHEGLSSSTWKDEIESVPCTLGVPRCTIQKMITVFQKSRASFHAVAFFPFLFNATRLTSWKVICLCTTADRHLGHVNFGNLLMEFGDRRCCIFVGKPGWESPRELLTWTLDLKHGPQWVCWAFTSDYSIALDTPTFMGMIWCDSVGPSIFHDYGSQLSWHDGLGVAAWVCQWFFRFYCIEQFGYTSRNRHRSSNPNIPKQWVVYRYVYIYI